MERLQQSPFYLRTGDAILVQASAKNEAGESLMSSVDVGHGSIRMLDIPRTISKPSSYGKDQTGFTLAWVRQAIDDDIQVYCGADN